MLIVHRGAEAVARVVELKYLSAVLLIPEERPALVRDILRVNHRGIVDNPDHAVGVGNGVGVFGVVIAVFVILLDVLKVRYEIEIQRQEEILGYHFLYHVVGGDYYIV